MFGKLNDNDDFMGIVKKIKFEAVEADNHNCECEDGECKYFTSDDLYDIAYAIDNAYEKTCKELRILRHALHRIIFDQYLLGGCYSEGKCDSCPYYTGSIKVGCAYRVAADALKEAE